MEASRTQQDCVPTLKSSLPLTFIPKGYTDFHKSAAEMKTKHYQRRISENTFSVKIWKVSETTKYCRAVPDGKKVLEKFHLITFVQDVLIWTTYINCILKLTVLPTEVNVKLPGAWKSLSAFKCKYSIYGADSPFVALLRKSNGSLRHCKNVSILKAALKPFAHLGQFLPPMLYLIGRKARSQFLKSVMCWEREGTLDKYEGSSSYNLINIQQAPSALTQGNSPNGCSRGVSLNPSHRAFLK